MLKKSDKLLLWVDCEMTGLDPMHEGLLEIATIITNYDLEIVDRGPDLAIRATPSQMRHMNAWNRRTHAKSGLLERVKKEGITTAEAERQTLKFVRRYCQRKTAPLCGNNVGHDKRFIARHMPKLYAYLHYRIIDVSSIKLLVAEWYGGRYKPPEKPDVHRALADIEESIRELQFYREHVFVKAKRN